MELWTDETTYGWRGGPMDRWWTEGLTKGLTDGWNESVDHFMKMTFKMPYLIIS